MGGSTTVSSSISSSLSTCSSGERNCIERSTNFEEALQQKDARKRSPRFFFWTLNFGSGNKNKDKNKRLNSNESTPRSPDSSRSVKFDGSRRQKTKFSIFLNRESARRDPWLLNLGHGLMTIILLLLKN
uniref:Uncharacterized protein n=1 Tax=Meloidogyne incognita TaxID=6306 RepID=A0A914LYN7_MELIC